MGGWVMVSISKHSPPICANGLKSQRLESAAPTLSFSYLFTTWLLAPTPSFTFSALSPPIHRPYACFSSLQLRSGGRDETISLPLCSHFVCVCVCERWEDGSRMSSIRLGVLLKQENRPLIWQMLCEVQKSISKSWGYNGGEKSVFSSEISCFSSFCRWRRARFCIFLNWEKCLYRCGFKVRLCTVAFLNRGLVFHGFYSPTAHTGSLLYTEKKMLISHLAFL